MNARNKRPLFRGILVALGDWFYQAGDPVDVQRRAAIISIWCPLCGYHHTHGWDPANDGSVVEHRIAHCRFPSPSRSEGFEDYWISTFRKYDPEYAAHVTRPGRAIIRRVETICPTCGTPADELRRLRPYPRCKCGAALLKLDSEVVVA